MVDPLADSYHSYSPYNYALNDPTGKLDPNGMWVETAGGWSTNDPNDIAEFMQQMQGNNQEDGSFSDGNGQTAKEQDPPVKSQRISQGGEKVYSNINDPIERVFRWFVPREYKDPITGKTLEVDNDGYTVGSMLTGTPDLMGGLKQSSIIRFGKGANQV